MKESLNYEGIVTEDPPEQTAPDFTEVPNVYSALAHFQNAIVSAGISKDDENRYDNYRYRGIDAVYDIVGPMLRNAKLMIRRTITDRKLAERPTAKGGVQYHAMVVVDYDYLSLDDGSTIAGARGVIGEAMDRGDKAFNKAMTAAYKYMLFQEFCIPLGSDDADANTPEHTQAQDEEALKPITKEQAMKIDAMIEENGIDRDKFLAWLKSSVKAPSVGEIKAQALTTVMRGLQASIKRHQEQNQ